MIINDASKRSSVNNEQISHYQQKLQYEIDSWDLYTAIKNGEEINIIDARSIEAYNNGIALAKNRNVPDAVRRHATRLLSARTGGGRG